MYVERLCGRLYVCVCVCLRGRTVVWIRQVCLCVYVERLCGRLCVCVCVCLYYL